MVRGWLGRLWPQNCGVLVGSLRDVVAAMFGRLHDMLCVSVVVWVCSDIPQHAGTMVMGMLGA